MFYRKKDAAAAVIQIQKDDEVQLFIGDSFGLLVDEFWFVIESSIPVNDVISQHHENGIQTNGDVAQLHSTSGFKRRPSTGSEPDSTNKKVKTEPNEFQAENAESIGDVSGTTDQDMNITANVEQIAINNAVSNGEIPSTSTTTQNIPQFGVASAEEPFHRDHRPIKIEPVDSSANEAQSMQIQAVKQEPVDEDENENVVSTNVLNHVPLDSDIVVKTEVKQEPTDNSNGATTSSGSTTNQPTQRACCKYGIRCYR